MFKVNIVSNKACCLTLRHFNGFCFSSFLSIFIVLLSFNSSALPTDNSQPIQIQADSAKLDEKEGRTVYSGNVSIQQGSIKIFADTVSISSKNGKAEQLLAEGSPAHYEQQPTENEEPIIATAGTLKYLMTEEVLHLINNASLTQNGAVISGARINYDVRNAVVKADSTSKPGTNPTDNRVQVVIPPAIIETPSSTTEETP